MTKTIFKKSNTNNKRHKASTITFIIFFIVVFLALSAFAVDGTMTFTNRMKLQNITEETALMAASEFNYSNSASSSDLYSQVYATAQNIFYYLKQDGLQYATMNLAIDPDSRKVSITTTFVSQPFFLSFLGVSGVNLTAKAGAISEALPVTANYSGINWLTASAAYLSDILSKDVNLNDTAIMTPLGKTPSASYDSTTGFVMFSNISSSTTPLSLGPGGFITIKLPAPITDKTGYDLYIKECGEALEGYMVFAGIDNNPNKPYVNSSNTGDGISWINITSTGTSEYSALDSSALQTANTQLPTNIQDKIYGSAYFDISKKNLSMVKYIRIVDDNQESAFYKDSTTGNYYKAMIYGEASTNTAGADIGSVQVLNHVYLVKV